MASALESPEDWRDQYQYGEDLEPSKQHANRQQPFRCVRQGGEITCWTDKRPQAWTDVAHGGGRPAQRRHPVESYQRQAQGDDRNGDGEEERERQQ